MQPPVAGSRAELLSKRSSEGRKDPAAVLADAIRKVSASGPSESSARVEYEDCADDEDSSGLRTSSFTQSITRPMSNHR